MVDVRLMCAVSVSAISLVASCSERTPKEPNGAYEDAASSSPGVEIGRSCMRGEGLTAEQGGDSARLPRGVPFCLANPAYPRGYLTMNCSSDSDCPAPSRCDDGQLCRMPCSSDESCVPPSTCRAHGMPALSFCECASGAIGPM